jgi:two-component system cell cycle response regulator
LVPDEPTRRYKRGHLDERLGAALAEAAGQPRGVAVLVVAADGVEWVNRRWGRAAGDSVLRKLARRLAAGLAAGDTFARYDGNRFGIIRRVTSGDEALAFGLQVVRDVAGAPFKLPGGRDEAVLTISIGLAVAGAAPPVDAAAVVARAEAALRRAKDAGGDRAVVG